MKDIIERFKDKHGDKYDYSKVKYEKMHSKVEIVCNKHNSFYQTPQSHLKGCGCPKCAFENRKRKPNDTVEEFIKKAEIIHNGKYDYSKVTYIDSKTKVCIICPTHGEFWQKPNDHLSGRGCKYCYNERRGDGQRSNKNKFIEKANIIHNGKYDYSKVEYVNTHTKVCIICPIHGDFWVEPSSHLSGRQCKECAKINRAKNKTMTNEEFINKAKTVHGEKYDYSFTEYNGIMNFVEINCPFHGIFRQIASYHLSGNGCQQCALEMKESESEREIYQFVSENYDGLALRNYRKTLKDNRELDIYLPSLKLAIEFDGLFWHSTKNNTDTNYHLNKTKECEEKGIRLIHIFEDEWIHKKEIVKSNILKLLNSNKLNNISAEDCSAIEVKLDEAKLFLEENSIEDSVNFDIVYGLYNNGGLVSIMCFNTNGNIVATCDKLNTIVIGGFEKLLKHFIPINKPKLIACSIDRRWDDGSDLKKIGFECCGETEPSFTYVVNDRRLKESVSNNKIYDCGGLIFILNEKW